MLGLASGIISLVAAVITFIAAVISYEPPPPLPDGSPARVRKFSPKAILKGWIVSAVIGVVVMIPLLFFIFNRASRAGVIPPQFQGDPTQLPGFNNFLVNFLSSGEGLAASCASVFLFCACGSYSAAKQAKVFRLTHACVSIGSLWLICEYFGRSSDPAFYQFLNANLSPRAKAAEPIATLVGIMIGGIMGAED